MFSTVLGPVVLPIRPADRQLYSWLCFPHDITFLAVHQQLGPVDLRVCAILHRHQQRVTLLFRDVLPVQRCGPSLFHAACVLALLDVLRVCNPPPVGVEKIADGLQKSFNLLDWWCPRGNT